MLKVCILDDYQDVIRHLKCFQLLDGYDIVLSHRAERNPQELAKIIGDAEVLVLTRERTVINEELLRLLPHLKLISQTGKIAPHLDLNACTERGICVAEGIGSPIAPAELCWALIMNAVRKLPEAMIAMKQGKWQINIGQSIYGKTIGIWGYGKIGQRIAQYSKAFGAEVLVWGSESSRQKALEQGFTAAASKEDFFRNADVVTLHLRLLPQTLGLVKTEDLMMMKDGAFFINTARAELVEKNSLENVLKSGKNIFVALDVFENEPIYDPDFPLLKYNQVICTPHLGYVEWNSYELYFSKAFENIIRFDNGTLVEFANPEVLKK